MDDREPLTSDDSWKERDARKRERREREERERREGRDGEGGEGGEERERDPSASNPSMRMLWGVGLAILSHHWTRRR
jgi:hypothetical protein